MYHLPCQCFHSPVQRTPLSESLRDLRPPKVNSGEKGSGGWGERGRKQHRMEKNIFSGAGG